MKEQNNQSSEQSKEQQSIKQLEHHEFDNFSGLPIDCIISEPLKAAAEAQRKLAETTKQFLREQSCQDENK